MNIKTMIAVSMGLVWFFSIFYFFIGSYLGKIYIIKKQSPATTTATNDWIKKMEEKYRKTNERIRKICKEYRETIPSKFTNDYKGIELSVVESLMVDVKHQLAYCPIEKVK
jgi:hypothetical protein